MRTRRRRRRPEHEWRMRDDEQPRRIHDALVPQPRGDMLTQCDDGVGAADQTTLQEHQERDRIAGMRRGVVHDHDGRHAGPPQCGQQQQVERARHGTDRQVGAQHREPPAQPGNGQRGSQPPDGQPNDTRIGCHRKHAIRRVGPAQNFGAGGQGQHGLGAGDQAQPVCQRRREARARSATSPLPDQNPHAAMESSEERPPRRVGRVTMGHAAQRRDSFPACTGHSAACRVAPTKDSPRIKPIRSCRNAPFAVIRAKAGTQAATGPPLSRG